MNVTLWGAYELSHNPLEQRPLSVQLTFERGRGLSAIVHAEGFAERTPAVVTVHRKGFAIEYSVAFAGGAGALILTQKLGGRALRTWTELAGPLLDGAGAVVGRARLRIDYRDCLNIG